MAWGDQEGFLEEVADSMGVSGVESRSVYLRRPRGRRHIP